MPDSKQRDDSIRELGKDWARSEPAEAAAWLKSQPDSSDRDLAVAGFAGVLAATDIKSAIEWAGTIPDEGIRLPTCKTIFMRWHQADPSAAMQWLGSQPGISQSELKSLAKDAAEYGPDQITYGMTVKNRR